MEGDRSLGVRQERAVEVGKTICSSTKLVFCFYTRATPRTLIIGARPESGEPANGRKVLVLFDIKHRAILPRITDERDAGCDLAVNNA